MISRDDLIKQLSNTIGKATVLKLTCVLNDEKFTLRDLIDLSFHPDRDIAFRAAWILETIVLQKPARYEADLEYLLSRFKEVEHESCKRHYGKMLMHVTGPKTPQHIKLKLPDIDLEPAVEQCFDWMIDPKVLVAVKVFASEALFNLGDRYPWIKDELAEQIRFLMRNGTAAIQSRGKKLLASLSSQ